MLRRILVFAGYILLAAVIIGATILLVAYGQGYEFDFKQGKIVHKGLVLIGASPSNSTVTRAGSSLHKHTTYHATYAPGSYTFSVSKDGYRTWTKTLTVGPGEVADARYVMLIPQTLVHATTATATAFAGAVTTKDRHHMAYVVPASGTEQSSVWTLDLPSGQPQRRFVMPTAADPTQQETIDSVQWAGDGSHLLVFSHTAAGAVERVMAADGTNVENITSTFATPLSNLQFAPTDWHTLYGIDADGQLRRIDLNSSAESDALATGVTQVSFANDQVLFVATTSLGKTLESAPIHTPNDISRLIPSLPVSDSYTISYSSFQGNDELIVIPSSTREATYYSGIFGSSPLSTVVARNVDNVVFSQNGRFAAMYSNNNLVTYDALLSQPKIIVTDQSPAISNLIGLSWSDNYHLLMNVGGKEIISDFDGTNRQILSDTTTTDIPFSSPDQHTAFALEPVAGGKQKLVSTALRQ